MENTKHPDSQGHNQQSGNDANVKDKKNTTGQGNTGQKSGNQPGSSKMKDDDDDSMNGGSKGDNNRGNTGSTGNRGGSASR